MRTGIFIAIILLVAIGFTSETFAVNPVVTQLEQHDTDIKADLVTLNDNREAEHGGLSGEHSVLDTKLNQLLSTATPSVPQPIQREFIATGTSVGFDIGTFTVPPSKMLVIELVTIKVPTSSFDYALSVTTTVGGTTVIHSVGNVHKTGGNYGGQVFQSFPVTLYADPNTNVIFSSVPRGVPGTTFRVTFSGRLIDVP